MPIDPGKPQSRKYSTAVRVVAGVLAVLGLSAIAFDAMQGTGFSLDFISLFVLFLKLFAAYVFSYVAIFGTNPLAPEKAEERDG